MSNQLKPIPSNSIFSSKQEKSRMSSINGDEIVYIQADRTELNSKWGNYFSSLNLPSFTDALSSSDSISKLYPELYQLNVDKVVLIPISNSYYEDYIDGRSITLNVPQINGASVKIVSTTYSSFEKKQSNSLLGSNVSFLFSDDINLPFSGTVGRNDYSYGTNLSTRNTWEPTGRFTDRFPAVAYNQLSQYDKGGAFSESDERDPSVDVKYAVNINSYFPENNINPYYKYDIPVGFAALDKGFIVITHPDVINNIPWTAGTKCHLDSTGGVITDGSNSASTSYQNIIFTGTSYDTQVVASASTLSFSTVSINFKTSVVCLAMPQEFCLSSNPSWDLQKNYTEAVRQTNNFDPLYITQVGLYNAAKELIAIAKFDRPVEKKFTGIINFNLDLDV